MANIILSATGDTCLQLSGSEAFYRGIDIPENSIDIRFGFMASLTGSTFNQTFNPVVSVYETYRLAFSNTVGAVPTGVTTEYIGFSNSSIGNSSQILYAGANPAYSGSYIASNGEDHVTVRGASSTGVYSYGSGTYYAGFSQSTNRPFLNMIRIYVDGVYVKIQSRIEQNGNVSGYNFHSVPVRTESEADAFLKDSLVNLSNTYQNANYRLDFANSTDSMNFLNSMSAIFVSWPFYNVIMNVHNMGYRSITA